ncbi:hypothetical protein ACFQFQ_20120 [Sulfitobacter porphyrae]|uniref:Uncharacterized protein n=1 Tax=Sulfitobacter porphyrae TaxID=1246864 RepID=A0ABW2B692_9RHOB|nr:hypothetical protein GCM10007928_50910 [Sulfitobacter porphyrae]
MQSYDDLESLLTSWYECSAKELALESPVPPWLQPDVAEFYSRFGELTRDAGRFNIDGLPSPLAAQDIITPVDELTQREDGGVILISENQGCWTAGQMPNSDQLWSSIDLDIGDTPQPGKKLFDMDFPIKEALITHTLNETIMSAVDCGPAFNLTEWDAAEEQILSTGIVTNRRYITPDEGTLRIGWTSGFMASNWTGEEGFTWVVRKGDRKKGPRPAPNVVGRPRADVPPKFQGVFEKLLDRFR